jgi:endonuclease/exonuclease/phosphatase family metal-dependent hydrolase
VRFRVATYNLKGFRLGRDRLVEAARTLDADLLLLQETGPRRHLRRFAADVEMQVAADPLSPLRRRVKNAVLARPPWRIVSHELHRLRGTERLYPRGALIAQVGRAGRRLAAVSAHLGLVPVERTSHAQELTDLFASLDQPLVLGIDLNESPDGRSAEWIASRYWDAWARGVEEGTAEAFPSPGEGQPGLSGSLHGATFPSVEATSRIDYLFVGIGLRVDRVQVATWTGAASDHLPIVADLTLEEPAAPSLEGGTGSTLP